MAGFGRSLTIGQADLADSYIWNESWYYNNPIPGGGGDDYGIVATGVLSVATTGVYSFALGNDDGARLRIDGVDVIVDDALHGFEHRFASIELTAGPHSFEWVGFERGFDASFEFSVLVGGMNVDDPYYTYYPYYPLSYSSDSWKVVGDASPAADIALDGQIDVTAYYLASQPVRNVVIANNSVTNNSLDGVNVQQQPIAVESLADVDDMASGAQLSESFVGVIAQADLYDGFTWFENWTFNHAIPGGGGDDFGIVATGVLNVTAAGLYSFAVSNDDGARLRIDGANVIVDDSLHGFENRFGSAELTVGLHTFEWTGFERGGDAGFELSVAVGAVDVMDWYSPLTNYPDDGWKVVGDPVPAAEIALVGAIDVTAYYLASEPSNLRIQSNAITGNYGTGVYLLNVTGSTILSNDLSFNGFAGVMLDASDDIVLTANTADGFNYGIFLNGSHDNRLTGNTAAGNFAGILSRYSSDNSFTGNSATGGYFGFLSEGSSNNALAGNVASDNYADGFYQYFGRGNTYHGNTASNNGGSGFALYDSSFNELQGNVAESNAIAGFGLYFSSNNSLRDNLAQGNGGSGSQLLYSSDANTLTDNRAVGNAGNGFALVYSSLNELSGNAAEENGGNGFYLEGAYSNTLSGNSTLANAGYGVFVWEEDVLDNIFDNNELLDDVLGDFNFPN